MSKKYYSKNNHDKHFNNYKKRNRKYLQQRIVFTALIIFTIFVMLTGMYLLLKRNNPFDPENYGKSKDSLSESYFSDSSNLSKIQNSGNDFSTENSLTSSIKNSNESNNSNDNTLSGNDSYNNSSQSPSATTSDHISSSINTSTSGISSILSTLREGWSYTPSGKINIPSTATNHRRSLCDQYNGIWQGNLDKKNIYITMDVGYEYNNNTTKILDIAKKKNFKINFFITGALFKTKALEQLVLRMKNEGHLVGNHTFSHLSMPIQYNKGEIEKIKDDINKLDSEYKRLTGDRISRFLRPPMGEYSEATMKLTSEMGYKTVFWSFAYRDWLVDAQMDKTTAYNSVIKGLHNGVVYLLHTVSNTNVEILPQVIDKIRAEGYEISLLSKYGE